MIVLPIHHWLYHVANCFLAISYLCTNILVLRLILFTASVCFVIWSALILGFSVDTVIYNSIFAIVNAIQAAIILYQRYPMQFVSPQHELVYKHLFTDTQYRLSRWEFNTLIQQGQCTCGTLKAGTIFAQPHTESQYLTLLIDGKMDVQRLQSDTLLYLSVDTIDSFEFIDSPEYMSRHTQRGSVFEVQIVALNDCEYLQWHYDPLNEVFSKNRTIENVFHALLGLDIANKLFHSSCKVTRH